LTTGLLVEELDIEGFRGIRRLAKPLKLAKLNVLVGRNNVGKTAILEALHMLSGKDELRDEYVHKTLAKLHGDRPSSLVYGYSGKAKIMYKLNWEGFRAPPTGKVEGLPEEVEFRDLVIEITEKGLTNAYYLPVQSELRGKVRASAMAGVGFETVIDFSSRLERSPTFYVPNHSNVYGLLGNYVLREDVWSSIVKSGLHVRVVRDLLAPTIYDDVTEVFVERGRLSLRKVVGDSVLYVDIDSLGEGVRRALLVYLAAEHLKPRMLLWDDIETAVHPSLLESVIKWLAGSDMQVVVTTHSLDVLWEVAYLEPRDCNVIVLRKSRDDIVDYRAFTTEEVGDMLESGIDLRKIVDILEL